MDSIKQIVITILWFPAQSVKDIMNEFPQKSVRGLQLNPAKVVETVVYCTAKSTTVRQESRSTLPDK